MIDIAIFLPLFTMGLFSGGHCIGMCGGIMGALTMAIPSSAKAKRGLILVAYNVGRITSYGLMGLLAGLFAEQLAALGGVIVLRILAGALLICMGLYLADWWRGLTKLETLGRYLWVYIQPLGKSLMPVDSVPKALLLGALWGWLPCGLVYAALAMAMTQPAPALAASSMLAFGLGTLPAVLAAGVAAQQLTRFLQRRNIRVGLAIIIILFGLWTIWGALGHTGHHHHLQGASDSNSQSEIDHTDMNHSPINDSQMDDSTMNHSTMDHSHMDHANMEHSGMHHADTNSSASVNSSQAALERQRTDADTGLSDNQGSQINTSASSKKAYEDSVSHY